MPVDVLDLLTNGGAAFEPLKQVLKGEGTAEVPLQRLQHHASLIGVSFFCCFECAVSGKTQHT